MRRKGGASNQDFEEVALIPRANFVTGDSIDPFNCTSIQLDTEVQEILQYFLRFSIPTMATIARQPTISVFELEKSIPTVKQVLKGALRNEMHMYALLSATAARMQHVSKITLAKKNAAHWFMDKAIACIRTYLQENDGEWDIQVVLDIFYLCVCEWYLCEYSAALTHLAAVGKMLKSLNADASFDEYIRETVCYNDIFIAVETGTAPLFPLTWDNEPLPEWRRKEISRGLSAARRQLQMGRGFTHPELNPLFSFEMNAVILELIPWIDVAMHAYLHGQAVAEDSEWACRKGQALLHRLLSITPPPASSLGGEEDQGISWQEESVRLTLVVLLTYITGQMAWRSGVINTERLRRAVECTDQSWGSRVSNQLQLWVCLCGAFAAEEHPNLADFFLERAEHLVLDLGVTVYDGLCQMMKQFLYSPRMQQRTLLHLLNRTRSPGQQCQSQIEPVRRQCFGFNLSAEPGRLLCRKGHWEATSTLPCLADFVADDADFNAEDLIAADPDDAAGPSLD